MPPLFLWSIHSCGITQYRTANVLFANEAPDSFHGAENELPASVRATDAFMKANDTGFHPRTAVNSAIAVSAPPGVGIDRFHVAP